MLDYDSFEKITPISLSVLEISDLILNYRTIKENNECKNNIGCDTTAAIYEVNRGDTSLSEGLDDRTGGTLPEKGGKVV